MKKKSPRGIPDFAHHPPKEQHDDGAHAPSASSVRVPRRAQPTVRGKPPATSVKSGQRGQ